MKKNLRKTLLLSAMALSIGGVAFGVNTVKTNAEVFTPSVKMVAGASVRIVKNDDAVAESGNGIRFTTYMAKADYETLMAENSGYTDVQFGVLVAPNTSAYTLTEKSVFGTGEDKKYAWAEWADTDGDGAYAWEYDATANAAYTRIMNFSSEKMYLAEYEWEDEANVYFRGSAIDINENNVPYEFQGIGYIKYTYSGATKYQFTTAETRSMTYVAQRAIEENDANATWLQQKYVAPYMQGGAKETATNYTVEHYFEQADGTYKLDETLTEQDTAFIGATITSNAKDVAYYQFNDAKAENKVEGTAYANDKLVLKRYYKLAAEETVDLGLKDTNDSETTVSIAGVPEVLTKKLYKVVGVSKTEVAADLTGETIALDGLNGVYVFEATKADGTVIVSKQFDAYDMTTPTWMDLSSGYVSNSVVTNKPLNRFKFDKATIEEITAIGGKTTADYVRIDAEDDYYAWSSKIKIRPLAHTKAYYELFAGGTVTFDWYYRVNADEEAGKTGTAVGESYYQFVYGDDTSVSTPSKQYASNAINKTTISIDALLAEWDNLMDTGGYVDGTATNDKYIGTPWVQLYGNHGFGGKSGDLEMYIGNVQLKEKEFMWINWTNGVSSSNGTIAMPKNPSTHYSVTAATNNEIEKIGASAETNFAKVVMINGQWNWTGLKAIPCNDKSFYEEYSQKNIAFDWYFELVDSTGTVVSLSTTVANTKIFGGDSVSRKSSTLHTETISMQKLLDDWANVSNISTNQNYVGTNWLYFANGTDFHTISGAAMHLYIGNFRIVD